LCVVDERLEVLFFMKSTGSKSPFLSPVARWNFPFMEKKGLFIFISLIVVSVSVFFILQRGFNFGVDFKGGEKLVYQFLDETGEAPIREALTPLDLGDIQIVQFGRKKEKSFLVKVKYHADREVTREVTQALRNSFGAEKIQLLSEETVGPRVGAELRRRGVFAIVLTWVLILIYIGLRFDFLFSPGAVMALIHDIIITVGFFTYFNKEINLPILAAALTIIGYSINDTIVVYDRIRENLKKLPSHIPMENLVSISLNETLSRTLVTSITLLFAVVVLFFLGGGVLHDFAFCMIIGVVVGTYSSIFIASPVYLACYKLFPGKSMVRSSGN
jgi:preprotein translocase subunit SecF